MELSEYFLARARRFFTLRKNPQRCFFTHLALLDDALLHGRGDGDEARRKQKYLQFQRVKKATAISVLLFNYSKVLFFST